ncbi:MAG: hypothetical protein KQI35_02980 [Bacteroidetes bacterium]|nr:hypothetical protein [Bacteroidota bacterium]
MKKLSYLLGLLVVAGMIFTSCSKDDEEPDPPTITFLGGIEPTTGWERVDGDVNLNVGEPFVFGFTASSNSDKNLSSIKVTRDYENVFLNTLVDSAVSVKTFTIDIQTVAYPNTPGTEVFEVTVSDKNGKTSSINFTVTTSQADPGISVFTDVELGSYTSTTNSSFASITGETFSLAEANSDPAVQAKIDWMYFHGATRGHTLMAPNNDVTIDIFPAVENWTNRNTTFFAKTTLGAGDYSAVENKNQLVLTITNQQLDFGDDFYSELVSNPGGFAVGDIIAFETLSGNYGLIKITEVNPGANNGLSTIKYDVKVEK